MKIFLDTINLTFIDFFDYEKLTKSFKELPTYEYFYKIQKLFEIMGWQIKDYNLKKLSQNFYKLYEDIYLEIKNYSANGEKSNPEKKIVMLQIKGQYFLNKKYEDFQQLILKLKELDIKISKIELAVDIQEEYVFESMTKTLKYKNQFIKLSGKETQYHLNFTNKNYESLTLTNSVLIVKIYNKLIEINLSKNKDKIELYYTKTNFQKNKDITRLELSLKRSDSINQNYIKNIIEKNEKDFTKIVLKDIINKIEILKTSKLKKVIYDLKNYYK